MYKVNEIFYSIQGEGKNTGLPAIFIRFHGCNLHCSFCDTPDDNYQEMSAEKIVSTVKNIQKQFIYSNYPFYLILTGGEPLLQLRHNDSLLTRLKDEFLLCLETNGTIPIDMENSPYYWIAVSPKPDSECQLFEANEVKLLVTPDSILHCSNPGLIHSNYFYLQPVRKDSNPDYNKKSLNNALKYIYGEKIDKFYPKVKWRLSCQIHKFLGLR